MNRRGFLSSLIAVPAAALLAPTIQFWPEQNPTMYYAPYGTVGAINRASYTFWRNQTPLKAPSRPLTLEMIQDAFDKCVNEAMQM